VVTDLAVRGRDRIARGNNDAKRSKRGISCVTHCYTNKRIKKDC